MMDIDKEIKAAIHKVNRSIGQRARAAHEEVKHAAALAKQRIARMYPPTIIHLADGHDASQAFRDIALTMGVRFLGNGVVIEARDNLPDIRNNIVTRNPNAGRGFVYS